YESTSYTRWARWFVADPATRTVLPSSSITLPQYVQSLLEQNTPQSWRQALLLQPTNAVALARVGGSITNLGLADWMTRRAIDLAPSRTEVWGERAQVLLKQGKTDESNEATARSKTLKNRDN